MSAGDVTWRERAPRLGEERAARKRAAAEYAVHAVRAGMVVGLGTGSTADFAIRALAGRIEAGLKVVGVATSLRSERLARSLRLPLADLDEVERVDLTIDGADEVERATLSVLKGHGGALLREKLVALASERTVIIVDDSKLVDALGTRFAVPVEVVPFGWHLPARAMEGLGGSAVLRRDFASGQPYVTDNHNYILDVRFDPIADPASLAREIKVLPGVIDHGLFVDIADEVVVGGPAGIEVLLAPRHAMD